MSAVDLLSDRHHRRRGELSAEDLIVNEMPDGIVKAELDAARHAEEVVAELRTELDALRAATRALREPS